MSQVVWAITWATTAKSWLKLWWFRKWLCGWEMFVQGLSVEVCWEYQHIEYRHVLPEVRVVSCASLSLTEGRDVEGSIDTHHSRQLNHTNGTKTSDPKTHQPSPPKCTRVAAALLLPQPPNPSPFPLASAVSPTQHENGHPWSENWCLFEMIEFHTICIDLWWVALPGCQALYWNFGLMWPRFALTCHVRWQ